jgi:hypothetical protein
MLLMVLRTFIVITFNASITVSDYELNLPI